MGALRLQACSAAFQPQCRIPGGAGFGVQWGIFLTRCANGGSLRDVSRHIETIGGVLGLSLYTRSRINLAFHQPTSPRSLLPQPAPPTATQNPTTAQMPLRGPALRPSAARSNLGPSNDLPAITPLPLTNPHGSRGRPINAFPSPASKEPPGRPGKDKGCRGLRETRPQAGFPYLPAKTIYKINGYCEKKACPHPKNIMMLTPTDSTKNLPPHKKNPLQPLPPSYTLKTTNWNEVPPKRKASKNARAPPNSALQPGPRNA